MIDFRQRGYTAASWVPAAARRETFELCSPHVDDERTSIAMLLVTELITNAVIHAGGAIELRLAFLHNRLRIEVHDTSPVLPRLREPGVGGRGLRLVEQLSERWGATRENGSGKVTWCEIVTG